MMDTMIEASLPSGSYFFTDGVTKREQQKEGDGKTGSSNDTLSGCSVKGMISYPCCPKETVMVYRDAHGQASNKCPRCGKFARFDYDRMTATAVKALRGASRMYKSRG